jgi:hypothetical protein
MVIFLLFFIQIVLLFFLSRLTINEIFYFLRLFIKEEKTVLILVSLLFLPGTIVHELSHFFAATILLIRVRELKIFPEFKEEEIKLGHVLYEKQDFIRGILIGIAPFFAGSFFFLSLAYFKIFPSQNLFLNLLLIYLIFAVSSTMFSSKKDLVDMVFFLPFLIVLAGIIYVFNLRLDLILKNPVIYQNLIAVLSKINNYLFISLLICLAIISILKIVKKLIIR